MTSQIASALLYMHPREYGERFTGVRGALTSPQSLVTSPFSNEHVLELPRIRLIDVFLEETAAIDERMPLAVLADDKLITTRTGKGSFVLFDGRPLDGRLGWTHALSEQGVETRMRTLRIELVHDPDLADRLGLDSTDLIAIERVRQLTDGTAISLERSRVAALDSLRDLPDRGLDNGSISVTLNRAGLYLDHCEQRLRGRRLSTVETGLLGRPEGTWFLHTTRTSWTADDRFAEYADELLDPEHYELSLSYSS